LVDAELEQSAGDPDRSAGGVFTSMPTIGVPAGVLGQLWDDVSTAGRRQLRDARRREICGDFGHQDPFGRACHSAFLDLPRMLAP
jgi:hypothetical protein